MTDLDPLMVELFKKVPPPGSVWPLDQRALWLSACEAIFNVIYGPVDRIDIPALFVSSGLSLEAIERLRSEPGSIIVEPPAASTPPVPAPSEENTSEPAANPEPVTRGAGGARGANRKSIDRPDGCPSNLEMAIATLLELGPSSGNAIREHVRRTWWPDAPNGWSGCLYSYAESGKLSRDGINFALPSLKGATSTQVIVDDPHAPTETRAQEKSPDSILGLIDPMRDRQPSRGNLVIDPKPSEPPPRMKASDIKSAAERFALTRPEKVTPPPKCGSITDSRWFKASRLRVARQDGLAAAAALPRATAPQADRRPRVSRVRCDRRSGVRRPIASSERSSGLVQGRRAGHQFRNRTTRSLLQAGAEAGLRAAGNELG